MWRQPKGVCALAFACVVAFMGIGLVDPILAPIAQNLDAVRFGPIRLATTPVTGIATPITAM